MFRKVEAIQRLAESSARVRLSYNVELEDIERAINLVAKSMKQAEYNPESGEFDANIIETVLAVVEQLDGATIGEIAVCHGRRV